MKMRKANYLFHRWIGLVVSIQLLAWSLGGLVFSISPIESVRGQTEAAEFPLHALTLPGTASLPESIREHVTKLTADNNPPGSVALVNRGLGAYWEVRDLSNETIERIDPRTGALAGLLTESEAIQLARIDYLPEDSGARAILFEKDPPLEYRSGKLPAWAVHLDHPREPHIYIDAQTGAVTARRNWLWRVFDFFWMLHTMDYAGRDNFNHLLLTVFSVIAVLTSASGLALWSWRAMTNWRQKRGVGAARAPA